MTITVTIAILALAAALFMLSVQHDKTHRQIDQVAEGLKADLARLRDIQEDHVQYVETRLNMCRDELTKTICEAHKISGTSVLKAVHNGNDDVIRAVATRFERYSAQGTLDAIYSDLDAAEKDEVVFKTDGEGSKDYLMKMMVEGRPVKTIPVTKEAAAAIMLEHYQQGGGELRYDAPVIIVKNTEGGE